MTVWRELVVFTLRYTEDVLAEVSNKFVFSIQLVFSLTKYTYIAILETTGKHLYTF